MAKQTQFQKGVAWVKKISKRNGKKRVTPGIAGRIGGFFIGVVPAVVPIPGLINTAQARDKKGISIGSNLQASFFGYINGLSKGIGFGDVFKKMDFFNKEGLSYGSFHPGDGGVPQGSTWPIWGTGFAYMAMDKIANFLNSGRGMKVPGTRAQMIRSG